MGDEGRDVHLLGLHQLQAQGVLQAATRQSGMGLTLHHELEQFAG